MKYIQRFWIGIGISVLPLGFIIVHDLTIYDFTQTKNYFLSGNIILTAFLISVSTFTDVLGCTDKIVGFCIMLVFMSFFQLTVYLSITFLENVSDRLCYIESIGFFMFSIVLGHFAEKRFVEEMGYE